MGSTSATRDTARIRRTLDDGSRMDTRPPIRQSRRCVSSSSAMPAASTCRQAARSMTSRTGRRPSAESIVAEEAETSETLRMLLPSGRPVAAPGHDVREIAVDELSEAEARDLTNRLLGTEGHSRRTEAIVRESGRSPLFLGELGPDVGGFRLARPHQLCPCGERAVGRDLVVLDALAEVERDTKLIDDGGLNDAAGHCRVSCACGASCSLTTTKHESYQVN